VVAVSLVPGSHTGAFLARVLDACD
jgi:hypothetical protein